MFTRLGSSLCVAVMLVLCAEPATAPGQTSWPIVKLSAGRQQLEAVLQRPVTVTFPEQTLPSLAAWLIAQCGVSVQLDRRALDDCGMAVDSKVPPFSAQQLRLSVALDRILKQVDLTWTVRDTLLVITTPEEAENELETHVYAVADLVDTRRASFAPPSAYYGMTGPRAGPVGARFGPNEFLDFDSLIDLIVSTIAPDTWADVGGAGSIEPFRVGQVLVISQTRSVHEQVDALLAALRHGRDVQHLPQWAFSGAGAGRASRSGPRIAVRAHTPQRSDERRIVYTYAPVRSSR